MNIATISQMTQQPVQAPKTAQGKMEGFGTIMSAVLTQSTPSTGANRPETQMIMDQAKQLIQTKDLQSLFDLLDMDVAVAVEDVEKVLLDGEIDFQQIAALLKIDPKELIKSLSTLLNTSAENKTELVEEEYASPENTTELAEDIWVLLQAVEQKVPEFQREIIRSLKNDGQPIANTIDVIKLLKTLEFALPKTDLTMKQEALTFSIKEVVTRLETALVQTEKTITLPEFRPMVRVVDIKTDTVEGPALQFERTITKTESHSVMLPVSRTSQGEALVKEFQAIMNRSAFGQAGGATKLLIKIYPENLGTVRIELVQKDGVLTARLLSSTALGKELLDSQSQQLRQAFAQQNIAVERLEISQALQDPARHDRNQSFGHQFKQQQRQEQSEQSDQEQPNESFLDLLMEVEV